MALTAWTHIYIKEMLVTILLIKKSLQTAKFYLIGVKQNKGKIMKILIKHSNLHLVALVVPADLD